MGFRTNDLWACPPQQAFQTSQIRSKSILQLKSKTQTHRCLLLNKREVSDKILIIAALLISFGIIFKLLTIRSSLKLQERPKCKMSAWPAKKRTKSTKWPLNRLWVSSRLRDYPLSAQRQNGEIDWKSPMVSTLLWLLWSRIQDQYWWTFSSGIQSQNS